MLLETSFFGEVVNKLETHLLTLTNEISMEDSASQPRPKAVSAWQQPRLGIFNVRKKG